MHRKIGPLVSHDFSLCEGFRRPPHRDGAARTGPVSESPQGMNPREVGPPAAPRALWGFGSSGLRRIWCSTLRRASVIAGSGGPASTKRDAVGQVDRAQDVLIRMRRTGAAEQWLGWVQGAKISSPRFASSASVAGRRPRKAV